MKSTPIRVLQVVSSLNAGGMENYIMNMYRSIDRTKIQFDFIVHHMEKGLYEDEIYSLGGQVFHFSVLDNKNIFQYIKDLKIFFKNHQEYRIIHGHLSSLAFFYFGIAKAYGVRWRIAHSHGAGFIPTRKGYVKYLLFRTTKWNANIRLACSSEAGKYLYGNSPYEFVPNGIDTNRFKFDPQKREQVREELGVQNNFVIGHIGRFNVQKNHRYLLEIFKNVVAKRADAKLLLLGDGELFESIKTLACELEIEAYVIFAGVHKDIENYYQAMDVFVLPSLFEGLPVTGIEAQYCGLPCLLSDEITKEVVVSKLVQYIPIGREYLSDWTSSLIELKSQSNRSCVEIISDIFDVNCSAELMARKYLKLYSTK